jgi:phosphoesterase RecJ-like protein
MQSILDVIRAARTVVISGHLNPDGDSIGSLLGLGLGLEKLGKRVSMVSGDGIPRMYRSLPGAPRILKKASGAPDLAIAVDCGTSALLGKTFDAFKRAKRTLEIDHHDIKEPYADLAMIDPAAAAVGELVYRILEALGVSFTRDIAQNILTSLIVETNSFRLPHLRPFTFEVCAALLKTGVDFHRISEMVYWSQTKEGLVFSGICLSRCRFLRQGRIVWSSVKRKDFQRTGAADEDIDAVPNSLLSIRGVEAAVFFRETKGKFLRVSLRSKGEVNVASIAQHYGGGGHFDSAGCTVPLNEKEKQGLLRKVEAALQ